MLNIWIEFSTSTCYISITTLNLSELIVYVTPVNPETIFINSPTQCGSQPTTTEVKKSRHTIIWRSMRSFLWFAVTPLTDYPGLWSSQHTCHKLGFRLSNLFESKLRVTWSQRKQVFHLHSEGLRSDCISRAHSAIWGILGTALQAYTLNPCTKFSPNPTSRKVNT